MNDVARVVKTDPGDVNAPLNEGLFFKIITKCGQKSQ